jgi:hypothetical protein
VKWSERSEQLGKATKILLELQDWHRHEHNGCKYTWNNYDLSLPQVARRYCTKAWVGLLTWIPCPPLGSLWHSVNGISGCSNTTCNSRWCTELGGEFLIIKPTRCTKFLKFILGMKLHMFWTVPLSIISSFSLYTQQWYMSYSVADSLWAGANAPAHKLSTNLYDIHHCCVYSEKLLTMDRGTVWKM